MADFQICQVNSSPRAVVTVGGGGATGGGGGGGGGGGAGVVPTTKETDRTYPAVVVKVDGSDLSQLFMEQSVLSVSVDDTTGFLPRCCVRLVIPEVSAMSKKEWSAGVEIEIAMGYDSQSVQPRGKFYCRKPRYIFDGTGAHQVELVGYGEGILLHNTSRTREFLKKKDSEIAEQIAKEYGLTADVDDTKVKRGQVIQRAETDLQLLLDLAGNHGFILDIRDGKLLFKKEKVEDSGVVLRWSAGDTGGSLHYFEVTVDPSFMGGTVSAKAIDPFSLEEYTEKSDGSEDELTKAMKNTGLSQFGVELASKYAVLNEETPHAFLREDTVLETRGELREMVNSYAHRLQWLVEGRAKVFAEESLKAGQTLSIEGLGIHSGAYLVASVNHLLTGEGNVAGVYVMTVGLRRAWTGKPKSAGPLSGITT